MKKTCKSKSRLNESRKDPVVNAKRFADELNNLAREAIEEPSDDDGYNDEDDPYGQCPRVSFNRGEDFPILGAKYSEKRDMLRLVLEESTKYICNFSEVYEESTPMEDGVDLGVCQITDDYKDGSSVEEEVSISFHGGEDMDEESTEEDFERGEREYRDSAWEQAYEDQWGDGDY